MNSIQNQTLTKSLLVTLPTVQWNQIPGMVILIQSVSPTGNQNVPSQLQSTVAHGLVTPCSLIQLNANQTCQKWSKSRMVCPLRTWSIATQAKLSDGDNSHNLVRNAKETKYYLKLRMDACMPIVVLNELPGCWKQCRQVRLGHWSLD